MSLGTCRKQARVAFAVSLVSIVTGLSNRVQAQGQVTSVVQILSSPNPVVQGQATTITAGVNWTAAAPASGIVKISDSVMCPGATSATVVTLGTIALGSATSATPGAGTLSVSSFPCAGNNLLTASYGGDSNYAAGTSATLLETVLGQFTATSVTLSSSLNPAPVGQVVTFTAQLNYTLTLVTHPTGTVTFTDTSTGKVLGTGTVVTTGTGSEVFTSAAVTLSSLAAGTYAVQAAYSGDNIYAPSSSQILSQVVQESTASATATALSASALQITAGQPETFTAKVTSSGGTPAGSVSFYDGAALLGTVNLGANGTAALTTSSLGVGSHPVSAAYGGSSSFEASTSAVVNVSVQAAPKASTSTVLSSSANPAAAGSAFALSATVKSTSAGTPTGTVTFENVSSAPVSVLGSAAVQNGVAALNLTLPAGSYQITASYGGDTNYAASSGSLTEIVNSPSLAGTTTTIASSANPSSYGQPVTFTAEVSGGTSTPSGTITFHVGSTVVTVSLDSSGRAVYTTSSLANGSVSVYAAYAGDSTHAGSTSPTLGQTVLGGVPDLKVTGRGFVYSRSTRLFTSILTVTNRGTTAIPGPIQVVFTKLRSGVKITNASGSFNGDPYITLTGGLNAGQSTSFKVQFSDPGGEDIEYQIKFYSGAF